MTAIRTASLLTSSVLLLLVTSCGAQQRDTDPDPSGPAPAATAGPPDGRVPAARRAPSVVVAEAPRSLTLSSGRTMTISAVGSTAAGLLAVPSDVDRAGWWRGGSRLGDPFGSTLVAAHVDSRVQGLGPFAELLTVPAGARVQLRSEHLAQTFVVRSRRLLPQGSLRRESWLFDVSGERRLTLVTCAPPYDASRGGYLNLAVVTAVPVSPVVRR